MITIYHNPRCSKSREALTILGKNTSEIEIVKYLNESLTEKKLTEIIKKLGISPIDLIRTNEAIWKENYKDKELSDAEIVKSMIKYPKLMERPIVINGNKAVVGRPPTKVLEIL